MGAALVLFCLQESFCYVAILSARALKPRFHATSGFFLNRRIGASLLALAKSIYWSNFKKMVFIFLEIKMFVILHGQQAQTYLPSGYISCQQLAQMGG